MTIALGLCAAVLFGASDLSGTHATRRVGPGIAMFLMLVVGLVPAVAFVALRSGSPSLGAPSAGLAFALLAGAAYYGGQTCLMRGVERGDLAVVGPIAALEGAVATCVAIGLGERPSLLTLCGLAVAVIGAMATASQPGGGSARGAGWGVASAVLFGAASILWAHADAIGASGVVMLTRIGGLCLLVPLIARRAGRVRVTRTVIGLVGIAAGLELLALAAAVTALAMGPVSVASVCQSQYGTAGGVLGILLLRERPGARQIAGALAASGGVALMALG